MKKDYFETRLLLEFVTKSIFAQKHVAKPNKKEVLRHNADDLLNYLK
jgi:hypothetical protein